MKFVTTTLIVAASSVIAAMAGLRGLGEWIDPPETKRLSATTRQTLGLPFIELTHGHVHYELVDRGSNDLVVFIHGYSSPSFVWNRVMPYFAQAGLSTLRYDLYGHGYSDRPNLPYNRTLFQEQLTQLIQAVAPERKLHIVAWSMGAMIAADFVSANPAKVKSVNFVSPSGLPIKTGLLGRVAFIPGVGDAGFSLIGGGGLSRAQSEFFEDQASYADYMTHYTAQTEYVGYKRAMLSTLREMDMDHFHEGYKKFATTKTPTLVVWGKPDKATPFKNSPLFQSLVPHATLLPMEGVGHASQYERPEWIAAQFIDFIQKQ